MTGSFAREQTRLFNRNRFKLGLFAPNCSGGVSMLKTELWDGSWEKSLAACRLADEAGLEFILPLGRWHGMRGYPHEDESQGLSYETLTWASAILALTREICVFGTLHVTFISPVFAAKMMVTVDHVGEGRFALNIVTGSTPEDFETFGVPFPDSGTRYAYTDEWVTIVKRIWSETVPFDYAGTYFNFKHVLEKPKPYGGTRPLLVSAANSAAGRRFAADQTDCLFLMINEIDTLPEEIGIFRAAKGEPAAPVLASGHMVARATRKEAREYYDYVVRELGDWAIVDDLAERRTRGRDTPMARMKSLKERIMSGTGTYPVVGSFDDAAAEFARMADAGLGGMAVGLFDYLGEFPMLQEVMARMQRLGLRE
jgi:FMNH2-dependent dimethyl sulfone monooxygenase